MLLISHSHFGINLKARILNDRGSVFTSGAKINNTKADRKNGSLSMLKEKVSEDMASGRLFIYPCLN